MESKTVVAALTALAHETRLSVYRMLVQAGPDGLVVGAIVDSIGIPPASLSFHLKELSIAGLVNVRRSGRYLHYSAEFGTMNDVIAYLTENCCGGMPCLPVCSPVTIDLPKKKATTATRKKSAQSVARNPVRKR